MECEVCGAPDAEKYHLRQKKRDGTHDEYTMILCTGCYNLRISQDWIEEI